MNFSPKQRFANPAHLEKEKSLSPILPAKVYIIDETTKHQKNAEKIPKECVYLENDLQYESSLSIENCHLSLDFMCFHVPATLLSPRQPYKMKTANSQRVSGLFGLSHYILILSRSPINRFIAVFSFFP